MVYYLGNTKIEYTAEGLRQTGDSTVLLDKGINLAGGLTWEAEGFIINSLYSSSEFADFKKECNLLLRSLWQKAGLDVTAIQHLHQYHQIASSQQKHLAAVNETKLLPVSSFPLSISKLENRISEICQKNLIAHNPFDGQSVFHFRVIRPDSRDNNPLHRDVWLEDYDDCINLYIPIAGSDENSTLAIIPQSHHWPECDIEKTMGGSLISGVRYNVSAVTAIHRPFQMVRPNPAENEVLIFSPYLIHGGAVNLNTNATRISIELRLWLKK